MASKKKIKQVQSIKKFSLKNPVFIGVLAVLVAAGLFFSFNTFAAGGSASKAAISGKDQYGCPNDYRFRPSLGYGSGGGCVWRLQRSLNQGLGISLGPAGIDGKFGQGTKNAVMYYQAARGLGVDGVVGPNTWYRLFLDTEI